MFFFLVFLIWFLSTRTEFWKVILRTGVLVGYCSFSGTGHPLGMHMQTKWKHVCIKKQIHTSLLLLTTGVNVYTGWLVCICTRISCLNPDLIKWNWIFQSPIWCLLIKTGILKSNFSFLFGITVLNLVLVIH